MIEEYHTTLTGELTLAFFRQLKGFQKSARKYNSICVEPPFYFASSAKSKQSQRGQQEQ